MNITRPALTIAAAALAASTGPASAAERTVVAAAPSASAAASHRPSIVIDEFRGTGGTAREPAVQKTLIEDDSTRIDELRVRGQLTSITVTSKGGAGRYEIITGDGSRDLSEARTTNRGAAGKRVWSVLRF